jgi:hypothetical protein
MKSEGKNLGGREYLKKKLIERGMSRRGALRMLSFIFEEMKRALARGEAVEFAGGKLVRVRKSFGQWWDRADDWPAHRQAYTVEWELSPPVQEQLCGPLEKEERAYLEAVWEAPEAEKRERRGRKKGSRLIGK